MIERQDGFQVVFESGTFANAMMEFTKYRPDVVFVDIDLNGESGLECAKVMTEFSPKLKVIFATAHSEYMANAFEIYAFDYLVKPFNMERVIKTLTRIKESFPKNAPSEHGAEVFVTQADYQKEKLMIKGKEQVVFIDKEDIIMIERENQSTCILYYQFIKNYENRTIRKMDVSGEIKRDRCDSTDDLSKLRRNQKDI